jgi:hypothetical protein
MEVADVPAGVLAKGDVGDPEVETRYLAEARFSALARASSWVFPEADSEQNPPTMVP